MEAALTERLLAIWFVDKRIEFFESRIRKSQEQLRYNQVRTRRSVRIVRKNEHANFLRKPKNRSKTAKNNVLLLDPPSAPNHKYNRPSVQACAEGANPNSLIRHE